MRLTSPTTIAMSQPLWCRMRRSLPGCDVHVCAALGLVVVSVAGCGSTGHLATSSHAASTARIRCTNAALAGGLCGTPQQQAAARAELSPSTSTGTSPQTATSSTPSGPVVGQNIGTGYPAPYKLQTLINNNLQSLVGKKLPQVGEVGSINTQCDAAGADEFSCESEVYNGVQVVFGPVDFDVVTDGSGTVTSVQEVSAETQSPSVPLGGPSNGIGVPGGGQ